MFTIDNNQVIINCKLLGGSDDIHMKNVRNHINKLVGGNVTKDVLHKTLTNIYNMTGGAEVVSKKIVEKALNQIGGASVNDYQAVLKAFTAALAQKMNPVMNRGKPAHIARITSEAIDIFNDNIPPADLNDLNDDAQTILEFLEKFYKPLVEVDPTATIPELNKAIIDTIQKFATSIDGDSKLTNEEKKNAIVKLRTDNGKKFTRLNDQITKMLKPIIAELTRKAAEDAATLVTPSTAAPTVDDIADYGDEDIKNNIEALVAMTPLVIDPNADKAVIDQQMETNIKIQMAKDFKKIDNVLKHLGLSTPTSGITGGAGAGAPAVPTDVLIGTKPEMFTKYLNTQAFLTKLKSVQSGSMNLYLGLNFVDWAMGTSPPTSFGPINESSDTNGVKEIVQKIIYIISNQDSFFKNQYDRLPNDSQLFINFNKYSLFATILMLCCSDDLSSIPTYPAYKTIEDLKLKILSYLKQENLVTFDTVGGLDFGSNVVAFKFNIDNLKRFFDNNAASQIGGENEITDFIPITYSLTGGGREINLSNFMIGILGQVIFSVTNNEQLVTNLIEAVSSDWDFDNNDDFWDPSDLVPEELSKLDAWERDPNGKLEYKKSDNTVVPLAKWYAENASNDNVNRAGLNPDDFNLGCWMNGSSVYESFVCQEQLNKMASVRWTQEQVNKMSPLTIFSILKSIGIKGEYETDSDGKEYMVIQNPSDWWNNLNDKQKKTLSHNWNSSGVTINSSASVINQAINATTLETFSQYDGREFIKKMRNFVNANPAIINQNYKVRAGNQPLAVGRSPVTGVASRYSMAHTQPIPSFTHMFHSALGDYGRMLGSNVVSLGNVFGLPNTSSHAMLFGHTGGFEKLDMDLIGGAMNLNIVGPPMFSRQIKRDYELFKSKLHSHKKKLTPSTDNAINNLIKSLESKEKQIKKLLGYFKAYSMVVNADSDFKPENITLTHLQNAMTRVSSRFSKYKTRAIAAADILNALHGVVKDTSGSSLPLNVDPQM